MTSMDTQLLSIENQTFKTLIISEISPAIEHYIKPSSVNSSNKTATFTGKTWTNDALINSVLISLTGAYRGKCYTITDNTADTITLAIDPDTTFASEITTSLYYAIVYTAKTMYDYCVTNSKDCVVLACPKFNFSDTLSDEPMVLPDHNNLRVGTGGFTQVLQLPDCLIWLKNPNYRLWKLNQYRELLYHWGQLTNTNPVYLIITQEHIISGVTYRQNWSGLKRDANSVYQRGYLSGFPMTSSGDYDFGPRYNIRFAESWLPGV